MCAVGGEGAAAGAAASSLPAGALVALLPRDLCWEQAELLPPAER